MKNSIYAFYTLLILSTLSCGKTTKGKLDNEWKVVEYEMKEDQIYNIGDLYGTSVHMTETDYTYSQYYTNPQDGQQYIESANSTVKFHDMTIDRNGTWSRKFHVLHAKEVEMIFEESGTWSFVKKNKKEDFKRKERVLFNILSESTTTINPAFDPKSHTETVTYLTGQKVQVFTVVESKKDELTMRIDGEYYQTNPDTDLHRVSVLNYVLKSK
jgi:hypothetical protein